MCNSPYSLDLSTTIYSTTLINSTVILTSKCIQYCPYSSYRFYNANLSTSVCYSCNSAIPGCTDCINNNIVVVCNLCATGWYLLNGTCYSSCPVGYYNNPVQGVCSRCAYPCMECYANVANSGSVGAVNCTRCSTGFNGTVSAVTNIQSCIPLCDSFQYFQIITQSC